MKAIYFTMALLLSGSLAWAQDPQTPPQVGPDVPQGPGRGIARISLMNGDVSVRRGDAAEVTAAAINAPLSSSDTLLTGATARVELQFDSSDVARVAANSEVHMGDLQYRHNQIQIAHGLVTFTVLRNSGSQSEIDTPNAAVHPRGPGAYRILVREDGTSEITVRGADADISSSQGSQVLKSGQTMQVRGSGNDTEFQILNAVQPDDWDRWNGERDRQLMSSTSTRYVNPDVNGAPDLDANGRWVNDGSYGTVWAPTVPPDWAPYQDGRWAWVNDYGWTWVSYEPWGWAPYHYGRWYRAGFGWAWWPGPVMGPCYWSPALVGFFGFGGGGGFGLGFGFGFANIGWVPLAPFERFHPWWGPGGFRSTAIMNGSIYNTYRNARVMGGVTGVAATNFGRGGSRYTAVSGAEIRNAGMVRGMLPVTPERSSLRFSDRPVNTASFRQSRNTQFFSRNGSSSQGRTTSFEQQRQMVQRASDPRNFGSRSSGNAGINTGRGQINGGESHAWSRFGEPIHSGGAAQPSTGWRSNSGTASGTASQQNGWSRVPTNPQSSGRYGYSAPSSNTGRSYSSPYGGSNAVRISPPIVRERTQSQPRYSAPSYGGGGGNARSSGGGGGGVRSSGGGGGGGHHR